MPETGSRRTGMKMNFKKMIFISVGILLISLALLLIFYRTMSSANPPLRKQQVKIGSAVFTVEVASTMAEQARGLSFRPSLAEDQGMFFMFGSPKIQNFWMKDMNFPIDIIWISGDKVVGFAEHAFPQPGVPLWSLKIYSSPDGTDRVLEVRAGTVARDNIKVGDTVETQGL